MKKYLVGFCCASLMAASAGAQTLALMNDSVANLMENDKLLPVKQCFVNMPDSLEPVLTRNNKLDCIDFLNCHMKAVIKNRFSKSSELMKMTNDYLDFHTSEISGFAIRRLPLSDSTAVLCKVNTVQAPLAESDIHFYDMDWNPLPLADYLSLSVPVDLSLQDIALCEMQLDSVAPLLKVTYRSMGKNSVMLLDNNEQIKETEKDRIVVYRWTDGRFVKKED